MESRQLKDLSQPVVRYYFVLPAERCSQCSGKLVQDVVRSDRSWEVRCWTCKTIRSSGKVEDR
jgi:hypothetical protein